MKRETCVDIQVGEVQSLDDVERSRVHLSKSNQRGIGLMEN